MLRGKVSGEGAAPGGVAVGRVRRCGVFREFGSSVFWKPTRNPRAVACLRIGNGVGEQTRNLIAENVEEARARDRRQFSYRGQVFAQDTVRVAGHQASDNAVQKIIRQRRFLARQVHHRPFAEI